MKSKVVARVAGCGATVSHPETEYLPLSSGGIKSAEKKTPNRTLNRALLHHTKINLLLRVKGVSSPLPSFMASAEIVTQTLRPHICEVKLVVVHPVNERADSLHAGIGNGRMNSRQKSQLLAIILLILLSLPRRCPHSFRTSSSHCEFLSLCPQSRLVIIRY